MTNATGLPISGIANGTDGELITWNASGVAAAVAVGSDGQVLTSGGAGVAPTFEAAGGGKVLQVVTGVKTSGTYTSSTSYAVIADFNVTITPSATSSKILVLATDNSLYRSTANLWHTTVYRAIAGGATTDLGVATYGFQYAYAHQSMGGSFSLAYLDSPSTTSAVTYQVYAKVVVDGQIHFANGNCPATITVMEIGE